MITATVYRVENRRGQGPYITGWKGKGGWALGYLHSDARHPGPIQSFGKQYRGFLYGFESMQALYKWFGGYLPRLLSDGYKIVKIPNAEIEDRDPNGLQVVFRDTR